MKNITTNILLLKNTCFPLGRKGGTDALAGVSGAPYALDFCAGWRARWLPRTAPAFLHSV